MTTQTHALTEASDAEFDVVEVSPAGGPAAAAARVASFLIGDPPEKRRGETDPDPIAVERALRKKAKPKARLFKMSNADDAQAYVDLEQRAKTSGEVRIEKIRELEDGCDYALFIVWLEFEQDPEVLKDDIESTLREKKAALLRATTEHQAEASGNPQGPRDNEVLCMGTTKKGHQCGAKRKKGVYCGRHAPKTPRPVAMDPPPPTHIPLSDKA